MNIITWKYFYQAQREKKYYFFTNTYVTYIMLKKQL